MKHTEQSIQQALIGFLSNPRYVIENLYVFNWESDLLFLTRAGYWYEVEIKISRADFFNDAKKRTGFNHLKSDVLTDPTKRGPNYFYYAAPKGLLRVDEIPSYAGLIEVGEHGGYDVMKKAPLLRKEKADPDTLGLSDKFYYNYINTKNSLRRLSREFEYQQRKYSDTKEAIRRERNNEKEVQRSHAVRSFQKTCTYFCNIGPGTCNNPISSGWRCGWCAAYKRFEEHLYFDVKPLRSSEKENSITDKTQHHGT